MTIKPEVVNQTTGQMTAEDMITSAQSNQLKESFCNGVAYDSVTGGNIKYQRISFGVTQWDCLFVAIAGLDTDSNGAIDQWKWGFDTVKEVNSVTGQQVACPVQISSCGGSGSTTPTSPTEPTTKKGVRNK